MILGLLEHIAFEEGVAATSILLGLVKRQVGGPHQFLFHYAVMRADRDANGRTDMQCGGADREALGQLGVNRFRGLGQAATVGLAASDDGELIAADPANLAFVAGRLAQPVPHLDQQLVANRMAQRVVDQLESVEIEKHDRHGR